MYNIEKIGKNEVIMQSTDEKFNYFAWPTTTKTKDGRIAVACSGFRYKHVCPFGKAVIQYSSDEGKSYTQPEIVINTVLDDRDAGLCAFGESGLILTSFNNSIEFQRQRGNGEDAVCKPYLDSVSPEDEKKAIGSEFVISFDNGKSWSEIYKSPITSPHGPIELKNKKILWAGRVFQENNDEPFGDSLPQVRVYEIQTDGKMNYVGSIEDVEKDGQKLLFWEPDIAEMPDGSLICQIRIGKPYFSLCQSESYDGGKTWTKPHQILSDKGGSPAGFFRHSSGVLMCTYSYREEKPGIRVMFSTDNGKSWDTDNVICEVGNTWDIGYPTSAELEDGSILTVFYAHEKENGPAVIMQQKWRFSK